MAVLSLDKTLLDIIPEAVSGGSRCTLIAVWLDRSGAIEPLLSKPGAYVSPRLSPDGERLALTTIESGAMSVWIHEPRLNRTMRLALAGDKGYPVWPRDGRFLVLGGPSGLASVRADSADRPQPRLQAHTVRIPWSFTPDGCVPKSTAAYTTK